MTNIADMTTEQLRFLQREWYKTAQADGSIDTLLLIGRELGTRQSAKYGPKFKWEWSDTKLYVDDYGHYMTVNVNGKQVCSTHGCDRLFIPGTWFSRIATFRASARDQKVAREIQRHETEREKLLNRLAVDV